MGVVLLPSALHCDLLKATENFASRGELDPRLAEAIGHVIAQRETASVGRSRTATPALSMSVREPDDARPVEHLESARVLRRYAEFIS